MSVNYVTDTEPVLLGYRCGRFSQCLSLFLSVRSRPLRERERERERERTRKLILQGL